ncbi:VIT1/CCC1 transporter family protein [Candidatus Micrarchaeota archaeon]|nr:VIT1/CCC1 transporter family protein [Candidatus Micrarchaeota archaeon]
MVDHPEDHDPWGGKALRDVVLGANDGFVSILGLVSGVAGGTSDGRFVVLAGVAGALAATMSMALGNYVSVKSQVEVAKAQIAREKRELEDMPDIERDEVRRIYYKKGFRGKQLDAVVRKLTADKDRWLRVMLEEEVGIRPDDLGNPVRSAILTGGAFALAACFPILPFVFVPVNNALPLSVILTFVAVFCVGAAKTVFTRRSWLHSGAEMVAIAAASSGLAYVAGNAIGNLFG